MVTNSKKRVLVLIIFTFLIETCVISAIQQNFSMCPRVKSQDNMSSDGESNNEIQAIKNLTKKTLREYHYTGEYNYTEQPPSNPSEWDGIYKHYTLVSQEADFHYDRTSENGSTTPLKLAIKYKLKDRYFNTYYKTDAAFNISQSPCFFWFDFPKAVNISFMRFYFYDREGLDFAPAVYEIYNDSTFVGLYNITPKVNGQWVLINFHQDIKKITRLTLKILRTRGAIDHPNNDTKVGINELELFENKIPRQPIQNDIVLYRGISKFWNGLDWALSLRIDDCVVVSNFPQWWTNITPLTVMCYNPSDHLNDSLVDTKHIEIGSHGSRNEHHANYDKNYSWWYTRALAAKSSIETYTNKTSLWSNKCISFAIPYSTMDPPGGRALLDAGFKYVGSTLGPGWRLRPLGRQNISLFNVSEPKSEVPMDWMLTYPAGNIIVPWDYKNTLSYKRNHSLAALYGHPFDILDRNFTSFVQNDTTGWHCTLGEISSYWWLKNRMNVTYNISSNLTTKIFDINILDSDPDVWEVPVSFMFNLTDFKWNGNILVKWRNNNTVNVSQFKNISGFFPGVGQHTNQTMQEGYRWDSWNYSLFVSVRPGDMTRPKSLYLFAFPNHPPNKPEKPSGPTVGKKKVYYAYTTKTIDVDGDKISYWFDWGDGTTSGWLGPYVSGFNVTEYHQWTKTGIFSVKVKAKDKWNESVWSDPLMVEILGPELEIQTISGGIGARAVIKNCGNSPAHTVRLWIKISGGFLGLINKVNSRTLSLLDPQNKTLVTSGVFFGLGKITIRVSATCDEEPSILRNATGLVLGLYVVNVRLK